MDFKKQSKWKDLVDTEIDTQLQVIEKKLASANLKDEERIKLELKRDEIQKQEEEFPPLNDHITNKSAKPCEVIARNDVENTHFEEAYDKGSTDSALLTMPVGLISPVGNKKLPKNNWKKMDIQIEYNSAREIPKKRREFERRRDFEKREKFSRKNNIGSEKDVKGKKESSEFLHTEQLHCQRPNRTLDRAKEKINNHQVNEVAKEVGNAKESSDEIQTAQQNQDHQAYWYFDEISDGFYYQHLGSQGWKKNNSNKSKQPQTRATTGKLSPRQQQSPNHNSSINSSTQTEQQTNMAAMNSQIVQRPVGVRSQMNGPRNNVNNNTGYNRNRRMEEQATNYPNSILSSSTNNSQWASTSGGMRSHQQQNGPRPQRPPFRPNGGDGHRRNGGFDYWKKNGGANGGGAPSNFNQSRDEEKVRNDGHSYQRHNDRWNYRNHHPNAPPPLSHEQRQARGPLPDWDQVVQEAGAEESFDYMGLMEGQYPQYYALTAVPPFDPSMSLLTAAADPTVAFQNPNYLQQLHNSMTLQSFRPNYLMAHGSLMAQPATFPAAAAVAASIQTAQAPQEMIARPDTAAVLHISPNMNIKTAVVRTAAPTIVTTATVPSIQPTSLLSPNGGLFPFPLAAANAIQSPAVAVATTDHIPTTASAGPFTPTIFAAQFPQTTLFTAAPTTTQLVPIDEFRLKELVRGQIEYYFSADNLQKDFFLRRKMDIEGFLPLSLIESFPRVRSLTLDHNFIVESLCDSEKIELSDDKLKIRPRIDPLRWPLFESGLQTGTENSPSTGEEKIPEIDNITPNDDGKHWKVEIGKTLPCVDGQLESHNEQKTRQIEKASAETNNDEAGEKNETARKSIDGAQVETNEKPKASAEPPETTGIEKQEADDDNWMEVKTKRNKRNNRSNGNEFANKQAGPDVSHI